MENILFSINLDIHILAAIFCVAAPFYQLRWVKRRGKLGKPLIFSFDRVMESVLDLQVKLCFALIITLILSGIAFPLIHYGFHGSWKEVSNIALVIFFTKMVLALIGLAINTHSVFILNPQIQETFAAFTPEEQPPDELLSRFWKLRTQRKMTCQFCFVLALIIVIITPLLRFYK